MSQQQITRPIRVMLVDDHPVVRKGLALIFEQEADIEVVAQAGGGPEAIAEFRLHKPDITLMDLKLDGMSGTDTVEAIRTEFPRARIVMLSTYNRDDDVYRSIRAGAMGYLVKDSPYDEIAAAIRIVHGGRKYFPPPVSEKLAERLSIPELTDRESDVLRQMAAGRSNKEIAETLSLAVGTVKSHVNSILEKLGADDRTQAVVTALKKGLTELDDTP